MYRFFQKGNTTRKLSRNTRKSNNSARKVTLDRRVVSRAKVNATEAQIRVVDSGWFFFRKVSPPSVFSVHSIRPRFILISDGSIEDCDETLSLFDVTSSDTEVVIPKRTISHRTSQIDGPRSQLSLLLERDQNVGPRDARLVAYSKRSSVASSCDSIGSWLDHMIASWKL